MHVLFQENNVTKDESNTSIRCDASFCGIRLSLAR
jgi:hypothetical protein